MDGYDAPWLIIEIVSDGWLWRLLFWLTWLAPLSWYIRDSYEVDEQQEFSLVYMGPQPEWRRKRRNKKRRLDLDGNCEEGEEGERGEWGKRGRERGENQRVVWKVKVSPTHRIQPLDHCRRDFCLQIQSGLLFKTTRYNRSIWWIDRFPAINLTCLPTLSGNNWISHTTGCRWLLHRSHASDDSISWRIYFSICREINWVHNARVFMKFSIYCVYALYITFYIILYWYIIIYVYNMQSMFSIKWNGDKTLFGLIDFLRYLIYNN